MTRGVRITAAVLLALIISSPRAFADGSGTPSPVGQVLTRSAHGLSAVLALADRLPAVAATNRMSATTLASILQSDPTAWIGPDGRLFYQEAPETVAQGSGPATLPTATYPENQTFALHSLPSSTHTIYLDFNGADVSGTWWNDNQGMPARFYTGFTLDSDPSTFTSQELAYIQAVWRIVAEKYAPFDVDVTTQDPGPDAYNRSSAADQTYGDHVVITDDAGAVNSACGGNCSGISLVGTFDDTWRSDAYYEPAWVFSSETSGSAILTAHTVAHEVGHTFGLTHDGDATHEYSDGHSNWFPLMGSSARGVGQFSIGEYAGANNQQDDLAIIAQNGAPVRTDDYGNTPGTAAPLGSGTALAGVISTRADQDVFAVNHDCDTKLTARATGIGAGASLDMSVTVMAADGTVVGSADPTSGQDLSWPAVPTGMDASLTVSAPRGTYYVRVDGVGKGDPLTNGYSDYASLGDYVLGVSACDGTMPTTPIMTTPTTTTTNPASTGTPAAPSTPGIGRAKPGKRGGPTTATVRWLPPSSNGGAAITGYRVRAELVRAGGRVVKVRNSRVVSAASRVLTLRLPKGHYRFRVVAYNQAGTSPLSAPSRVVRAR
jgi:hypothetical protein